MFQRTYGELRHPRRHFNDRLVEVIDLPLATPDVTAPLKVHPPNIGVSLPPQRPWVLYEFDDPALQSLAAGRKILLRMGPANERRLKARLAEPRRLLTARSAPRSRPAWTMAGSGLPRLLQAIELVVHLADVG